jgi:phenylalanyl-tRNA synthetase beta chain
LKLSFNWLNDFVDFSPISFSQIVEKIALSVCEIDEVENYQSFLDTVVTVKILSIEKHPNADTLTICQCDTGSSRCVIVTGAKNVSVGDIVPLALPGTILAGKKIEVSSLKGVASEGMFVSGKDMEISEDNSGVYIFPKETKLGCSVRGIFSQEDLILHVDNKSITHRPDLWSHFGFARELAAQLELPIQYNPLEIKETFVNHTNPIKVIKNENAHSYYASYISNILVAPSHWKIASRLQRCGVKSINNVVDVSNYVMLEIGQPTHFFDRSALGDIIIEVSKGQELESLEVLDLSNKQISNEHLVIRNNSIPVAIAGVIGGLGSSVKDTTTELLLESAVFKREDIRRSIKQTGIRSEASIRYEKGLEASYSLPVLNRCIALLKENGNPGLVAYKPEGFNNSAAKTVKIQISLQFINQKLGKELSVAEVKKILERLYFFVKVHDNSFDIVVPRFRHNYDITIPEDIVEEIGRTMEYSSIPNKPLLWDVKPTPKDHKLDLERKLKSQFASLNFSECYNYSFSSKEDITFEGVTEDSLLIQNTMPPEQKYLRTSIYPSLLKNIQTNIDRYEIVKLFEYGRTYHKVKPNELAVEKRWFGFAYTSNKKMNEPLQVLEDELLVLRDQLLKLIASLNIKDIELKVSSKTYLHPGASIDIYSKDELLGEIGYIHPKWNEAYGLKKKVIIGKLYFENLLEVYTSALFDFSFYAPSQFPQDKADISLLLDAKEKTHPFVDIILKSGIKEISSVYVHDVYMGQNIQEGKKSVTYRVNLLTYDKTFSAARIQEINQSLLELAKKNQFTVKGGL